MVKVYAVSLALGVLGLLVVILGGRFKGGDFGDLLDPGRALVGGGQPVLPADPGPRWQAAGLMPRPHHQNVARIVTTFSSGMRVGAPRLPMSWLPGVAPKPEGGERQGRSERELRQRRQCSGPEPRRCRGNRSPPRRRGRCEHSPCPMAGAQRQRVAGTVRTAEERCRRRRPSRRHHLPRSARSGVSRIRRGGARDLHPASRVRPHDGRHPARGVSRRRRSPSHLHHRAGHRLSARSHPPGVAAVSRDA